MAPTLNRSLLHHAGELKPSPKGLSLKPAEWAFLVQHMDTISDRLSEKASV